MARRSTEASQTTSAQREHPKYLRPPPPALRPLMNTSQSRANVNAEVLLWQSRVRMFVALVAGGAEFVLQQHRILHGNALRFELHAVVRSPVNNPRHAQRYTWIETHHGLCQRVLATRTATARADGARSRDHGTV